MATAKKGDYVTSTVMGDDVAYFLSLLIEEGAPSAELVWWHTGQREILPYNSLRKCDRPSLKEGAKLCEQCHIPLEEMVI